jgi:hypothetical protein
MVAVVLVFSAGFLLGVTMMAVLMVCPRDEPEADGAGRAIHVFPVERTAEKERV